MTSVTLTFDLWPWPFAWTSLLSLVMTPENFMMIWWWEHGQKGVTDGQTDGQTDGKYHSLSCLVAAKNVISIKYDAWILQSKGKLTWYFQIVQWFKNLLFQCLTSTYKAYRSFAVESSSLKNCFNKKTKFRSSTFSCDAEQLSATSTY